MSSVDPNLDSLITNIAPQILSLITGLVVGAGGVGLGLAVFVNKKKHLHSTELTKIAQWLAINVSLLALGGTVFVFSQVAFLGNSLASEAKEFLLGLLNAHAVALTALILGMVGACVSAVVGYRSQHRKVQRREVAG